MINAKEAFLRTAQVFETRYEAEYKEQTKKITEAIEKAIYNGSFHCDYPKANITYNAVLDQVIKDLEDEGYIVRDSSIYIRISWRVEDDEYDDSTLDKPD